MNIFWRNALRHMLQVLAFCCVVAVLTTAIWPRNGYLVQLGNSAAIGLTTWAVIEFGRLLVHPKHCYTSHDGDHGWPRGWRGVALAVVGIACGFFIGDAIGNRLFTPDTVRSDQDNYLGLIITIVAGAVATFYFYTRGKAAALEAGKAAGMLTCAVTYGYRPAEVLKKMSPDLMIEAFPDLMKLPQLF